MPGGAKGFVSCPSCRAIHFPGPPVLPDRDDRCGLAVDDGAGAAAGVIGAVSNHPADLFAPGDLIDQLWQDRTVPVAAGGELHRRDVRGGCVHGRVDLAPLASPLNAVIADLSFTARRGTCSRCCPPAGSAAHWRGDAAYGRPASSDVGQGGIVGHRPVQTRHLQQAGHHPGRLPQWQLEQNLDRKAELDRRIREYRRTTGAAVIRRKLGHVLVPLDQPRPALTERSRIAGPVRRAVAGWCRFPHAFCLTAWIRDVNPRQAELCNNARARVSSMAANQVLIK